MQVNGEIVFGAELHPKARERLRLKLTCPNHRYIRAIQMGRHPGAEPPRIEATVEMPDGSLHIPRGAIELVKEILAKDGFAPRCNIDNRTGGERIRLGMFTKPLRDYQGQGINELMKYQQGLIVLPCACGKTILGVGLIAALSVTTLVAVPTQDLADQWEQEIRTSLGVSPGILSGDRKEIHSDIVVGVIDSIVAQVERDSTWATRFGLFIMDEAHGAPAVTVQRALRGIPSRYRLGLTATPDREDGLTRIVEWSFGKILLERTTAEMIKLGYLMPAEIDFVETGWRFSFDGDEKKRVTTMEKELSEDLLRNALIAEGAANDAIAGESVLVLCNRREHCKTLADMINANGVNALAVTGKTAKRARRGTIEGLRENLIPVMIATSLADQGLDIRRLSALHLAYPQKAKGRTIQRLGRLLRQFEGKKPRVKDYIDSEVPTLERRASARRRVYKDAGLLR
jgi:superfamily II DNA or RNA helicase